MRLEAAGKKGKKLGDLSGHNYPCGNHNREPEICKVSWKSNPELTSTDRDRIVPHKLPSSDEHTGKTGTVYVTDTDSGNCKMAMGAESDETTISKDADSDRNKTPVVPENKENEAIVRIPDKVIVTQREKDFSKKHEKQRDLSDDDSSSEDSENDCIEDKEELTRKPVLNINIPSDSVSDVENQLKNLEITQSGDGKGDLWERSPMGSEKHRVRCDPPYPQVSSQLRCNGGGIVAESPAALNCLYNLSSPAVEDFNINELSELNNNVLLPSAPEFPFGEESSLPEGNNNFVSLSSHSCLYGEESCPLPDVEQKYLDVWVPDNTNDSQPWNLEVGDDTICVNSPNIHPEWNDLCSDGALSIPLSNPPLYREPGSIASLSSPSSGSPYSSQFSPSSSPVPSLPDSVTGKSDSDTEYELRKIESDLLQIGYVSPSDVPSCSAQSVNDRSLNELVTSSVTCDHRRYPLVSDPYTCFHPSQSAITLPPVHPSQSPITVQLVRPSNQAVTKMLLTEPARRLHSALPVNYLQSAQSASHLHPSQSPNSLQPVTGMQQTQQTVSVWQTKPVPPAINVKPRYQNMQIVSSTNTQTVISQSTRPFPRMPPSQTHIQQGPIIPETVAVSARERIAAKVDKAMKDRVVMSLAKLPDDQLSRGDEHGDTQLMILLVNEHPHKLEKIYVIVTRLKNIPGALVARNALNQSALSLACLFLHNVPLLARFIAEVMLEKGLPVNEVYDEGNTLLHLLCTQGDSHVKVLAELLSMKDHSNAPCFDVNQHNHREGTPLHVAVKKHSKKVNCSQTVAFLLSQGADVLAQERSSGLTALHMAIKESCDPLLVQLLLQAAERRNINLVSKGDYPGDTALHYIALRNDIALHQQAKVFQLLVWYGAVSNRCGSQGRTPLALVSAERKREIQKIMHRR